MEHFENKSSRLNFERTVQILLRVLLCNRADFEPTKDFGNSAFW